MLDAVDILLALMAMGLLALVAWTDFDSQKIRNNHVLALASVALARLGLEAFLIGIWAPAIFALAAAMLLFAVLFPFWLMGKVGAGDVKLIAVAPLVAGSSHLLALALLLFVATLLTLFLLKNPMLLPEKIYRRYIEVLDRKRIVPFGVPVSMSLIAVLVLQMVR